MLLIKLHIYFFAILLIITSEGNGATDGVVFDWIVPSNQTLIDDHHTMHARTRARLGSPSSYQQQATMHMQAGTPCMHTAIKE